MKKSYLKLGDIFLCVFSLIILFSFMLTLLFSEDKNFSEKENRALSTRPQASISKIINGRYFSDFSDFCTDQFPARAFFTSASYFLDISLCRKETNNVVIADDGYLIARHDYSDLETLRKNCEAISSFLERSNENGTPASIFIAPRSIDVNFHRLPENNFIKQTEEPYKVLESIISHKSLINSKDEIKKRSHTEYVWYRTDHHWTTKGAYYAYRLLASKLEFEPLEEDFFEIETISASFLGSTFSRLGISNFSNPDTIELYRYDNDDKFYLKTRNSNNKNATLYDFNKLNTVDKYAVFLGGNTDLLQIRNTSKSNPKMLVIKDSFANSLVPFLAIHYDLDVIDLRYFKSSLTSYINENKFDQILLIYGIDTLATDLSCSNILK